MGCGMARHDHDTMQGKRVVNQIREHRSAASKLDEGLQAVSQDYIKGLTFDDHLKKGSRVSHGAVAPVLGTAMALKYANEYHSHQRRRAVRRGSQHG